MAHSIDEARYFTESPVTSWLLHALVDDADDNNEVRAPGQGVEWQDGKRPEFCSYIKRGTPFTRALTPELTKMDIYYRFETRGDVMISYSALLGNGAYVDLSVEDGPYGGVAGTVHDTVTEVDLTPVAESGATNYVLFANVRSLTDGNINVYEVNTAIQQYPGAISIYRFGGSGPSASVDYPDRGFVIRPWNNKLQSPPGYYSSYQGIHTEPDSRTVSNDDLVFTEPWFPDQVNLTSHPNLGLKQIECEGLGVLIPHSISFVEKFGDQATWSRYSNYPWIDGKLFKSLLEYSRIPIADIMMKLYQSVYYLYRNRTPYVHFGFRNKSDDAETSINNMSIVDIDADATEFQIASAGVFHHEIANTQTGTFTTFDLALDYTVFTTLEDGIICDLIYKVYDENGIQIGPDQIEEGGVTLVPDNNLSPDQYYIWRTQPFQALGDLLPVRLRGLFTPQEYRIMVVQRINLRVTTSTQGRYIEVYLKPRSAADGIANSPHNLVMIVGGHVRLAQTDYYGDY